MTWDFHFALRKGASAQVVAGATRFVRDAQGLVIDHRDYWDACDFYATVPVLGAVVRRLKKRPRQPRPGPHEKTPGRPKFSHPPRGA